MFLIIFLQSLLSFGVTSHASPSTSSLHLCLSHERQALLAFKSAFTIVDFSDCQGDSSYAKTETWNNGVGDCCHWDGITCDAGHVTELDLSCSLLFGSFPSNSTLFHLRHLRRINLAHNDFSLSIPPDFVRLSRLTYLNLSNSGFSGQVPREIGWLSRLTTLDLSENSDLAMSNFNTIIANLTDLRDVDLFFVRINSKLPPMIANLSKLVYLQLPSCGLLGDLRVPSILNLPNLRVLDLGDNPNMHCDFSTSTILRWRSPLEVMDLSFCKFTSKLPDFIGEPSNFSLRSFDVHGCGLYGDIPSWTWNVAEVIKINFNNLSGSIPATVNTTKLTKLSTIDFSGNKINGTIPSWMFTLPSLSYLHLDDNLFNEIAQFGTIVNISTSSSSQLVEFSAKNNQLQGEIPESIFNLHNLRLLDLESNNLSGTISLIKKVQKLQNLDTLRLSHNNLLIKDDMDVESSSLWPSLLELGLSSCNLGHFPSFLRGQDNLTTLDLSKNDILGDVPEWFLKVGTTSLQFMDLSHNLITGGLKNLSWQNLNQFDISFNTLKGGVPVPSPTTSVFSASNNQLSGEIPSLLCQLPSLTLDLSHNNLTGKIPDCFDQLNDLDLSQNQLEGEIPSPIFQDCWLLSSVSLGRNLFEGPIPLSLNNCIQLGLLDLGRNKLSGTFPHWLGSLPSLQVLILGSNNFKGPLTSSNMTNMFSSLHILDISNNHFTGALPRDLLMNMKTMIEVNNHLLWPYKGLIVYYIDSMMAWVKGLNRQLDVILDELTLIDASNNRLEGHIPEAIGDLVALRWLNLAHNNFTGNIPQSLGNLNLLESLDLSYNRLEGHIPSQLVNMNSLEYFNVSENNLVGSVPIDKQFSTFSDSSYYGNPRLCGEYLTKKCRKNDKPSNSTPTEIDGFKSSSFSVWEIVLMGIGCGLFVGSCWGYFIFWENNYFWVDRLIFNIEVLVMLYQMRRRPNRRN